MHKISEVDLAKKLIPWLEDQGWIVYKEVRKFFHNGGSRADIVAIKDVGKLKLSWIIECKTSFTLALCEQIASWVGYSNYLSILVPSYSRSQFIHEYLKHLGIGVLQTGHYINDGVNEKLSPRLNRLNFKCDIRNSLREEQKTFSEAGNNIGHYFSPFQNTKKNLIEYVKFHSGCTLSAAIKNIQYHYSSSSTARSSIYTWIKEGVIKEIEIVDHKLYIKHE